MSLFSERSYLQPQVSRDYVICCTSFPSHVHARRRPSHRGLRLLRMNSWPWLHTHEGRLCDFRLAWSLFPCSCKLDAPFSLPAEFCPQLAWLGNRLLACGDIAFVSEQAGSNGSGCTKSSLMSQPLFHDISQPDPHPLTCHMCHCTVRSAGHASRECMSRCIADCCH